MVYHKAIHLSCGVTLNGYFITNLLLSLLLTFDQLLGKKMKKIVSTHILQCSVAMH